MGTEMTALFMCLQVKLKLSKTLWGDELYNQGLEQLNSVLAVCVPG